ncbi:WD and tetratricopeptide repeats protein 1-like [Phoenix dactylifera]|uniref:WD and tetratricopeptide repeats protein 1-like n=1 Tax=Phoenix dactylifera TaxID=42345 RepID=A0A8B7BNL8_PHODC|nr:WD and tetratricopeptide repeats protein 1-like [Phoenix dactylifera]XP_008782186.2 WD and tetratricopeptide repeats protein 1-like [Phoenix dactylifera]
MESWSFPDGNFANLVESRRIDSLPDVNRRLQLHSSLIQRLALEEVMEGHQGCVNAIAWNSKGSLLISGSDDTRINIWSYNNWRLLHSVETGHSANIFCTKFVPETSDELVVSGAGDAEVRLFNISRLNGKRSKEIALEPAALYQCHSRRVKKLAVEVGNPNVVWSASEDGTVRQHDLRESGSCPPAGSSNQECRNVLLDLRCGAKKSLADSPKQCLALKSCDISTTRPHQLLVGGSDAFARLYDRRMLPPLSSCQLKMKPPPCVNYFCPMHLSERRKSTLHLTHVTFSPNSEELLLSYSGEHVYLMDVNYDGQSIMRYTADDVPRQLYIDPLFKEMKVPSPPEVSSDNLPERKYDLRRLDMCKKLVQDAAKALDEGSNLFYGIEACNEVLDGKGPEIGLALRHECLCIRAALLLKRKWKNDVHMAIRDCNKARFINASSVNAHYYMSEALLQLGKNKEALEYAEAAHNLAPLNSDAAEMVKRIKDRFAAAEAEKSKKDNEDTAKSEARHGRLRSLSDVLFWSELSSPSQEFRYDREDSDYEEEMELDFETSISGDEGRDNEPSILRGSLNLRFHRRDDSARENCSTDGSHGSPSSSSQHENSSYQPEVVIDMKQRFVGHCNVGTDIKQASFLGQQGEYVASGSDDGRWFIWEKRTGRLIKMLAGDEHVVNCVQCHPFDCAIATSGIDDTIKMWTPHAEVPSMVAGGTAEPETADVLSAIENNQRKLCRNREAMLSFEFLERFRMHEFAEGTLHPFECAQS